MKTNNILLYVCWFIATISALGSLFFSDIMGFTPCTLCWYQRIAMYPLVILFGVGIFESLKVTLKFTFPVALIGWIIALWHNLLHYKIVPENASPCVSGVPCSTIYINWFGFLTIPALSFISFSIILAILFVLYRRVSREK